MATKVEPLNILEIYDGPEEELDFILPGMLTSTVGILVGPGGVSKSYLALQTAVSIALGRDIFHLWSDGDDLKQGRVVVLSLEDTKKVLRVRIRHVLRSANLPRKDIIKIHTHLQVLPLFGHGVCIGEMDPKTKKIVTSEKIEDLENYCKGALLTILDTFNRSLGGLDENSSGQMGPVLSIIEGICLRTETAFLIVHHTNKASSNEDRDSDQTAVRGASAITDNARWQTNLSTMKKKEADARGMNTEDGEHKKWVKVDLAKVNYGPPIETRWLYRGDKGVLNGWDKPPLLELPVNNRATKTNGSRTQPSSAKSSSTGGYKVAPT